MVEVRQSSGNIAARRQDWTAQNTTDIFQHREYHITAADKVLGLQNIIHTMNVCIYIYIYIYNVGGDINHNIVIVELY